MSSSIDQILERLVEVRDANAGRAEDERRRALGRALEAELAAEASADVPRLIAALRELVIARARAAEGRRTQLEQHVARLEEEAAQRDAEVSRLDEQLSLLREGASRFDADQQRLAAENESLRQRLASQSADFDAQRSQLDGRLSQLGTQTAELDAERQRLAAENESLKRRLESQSAELDAQRSQLDGRLSQLNTQVSALATERQRLAAENESLKKRLEVESADLVAQRSQLEEQRSHMAAQEARFAAAQGEGVDRALALERQLIERGTELRALQQDLAQAQSEIARLRDAVAVAAPSASTAPATAARTEVTSGAAWDLMRSAFRATIEQAPAPEPPPSLSPQDATLLNLSQSLMDFALRSAGIVDDIRLERQGAFTSWRGAMTIQLRRVFLACVEGKDKSIAALQERLNETLLFPHQLERAYEAAIPAGVLACIESLDPETIRKGSTRLAGVMTDWEKAFKELSAGIGELARTPGGEIFDMYFRELIVENMRNS